MKNQNSKTDRYISFRVSGKDSEVIEALMELWGENQSQTIKRALQRAYSIEIEAPEREGKGNAQNFQKVPSHRSHSGNTGN